MHFVTGISLRYEAPFRRYIAPADSAADVRALHDASDHAHRSEHRAGGGAFYLIHPEVVGELVRLVGSQILQVLVLTDVDALPDEEIDVDRVEASPVVELLGRRQRLYSRSVGADGQGAFLFDETAGSRD